MLDAFRSLLVRFCTTARDGQRNIGIGGPSDCPHTKGAKVFTGDDVEHLIETDIVFATWTLP